MASKFHAIGDIREGQRGELVNNIVSAEIEGLALERLHLQILQNEVV